MAFYNTPPSPLQLKEVEKMNQQICTDPNEHVMIHSISLLPLTSNIWKSGEDHTQIIHNECWTVLGYFPLRSLLNWKRSGINTH